jgi:hypothetical protein
MDAKEEYLFADEIIALINGETDQCHESVDENDTIDDTIDDTIEDVNKSNANKTSLKLIDENEDIFGTQTQTIDDKSNKSTKNETNLNELFGELSDEEFESNDCLTKDGKLIKENLLNRSKSQSLFETNTKSNNKSNDWTKNSSKKLSHKSNEDSIKEIFSGIRLINPLISSFEMKERMEGRKMIENKLKLDKKVIVLSFKCIHLCECQINLVLLKFCIHYYNYLIVFLDFWFETIKKFEDIARVCKPCDH